MEIKKIMTKQEVEKKKKKNQFYLVIALIIILIASTVGYGIGSSNKQTNTKKEVYGNFVFEEYGNLWKMYVKDDNGNVNENLNFYFAYSPKQLYQDSSFFESLKTEGELKTLSDYYQKPLYIYSDSNEDYSKLEIINNLFSYSKIVLRVQEACLDYSSINQSVDNPCIKEHSEYPIKTCQDNFIIIKSDENSQNIELKQIDNCLFITAKTNDLIKATDESLFRILGVK